MPVERSARPASAWRTAARAETVERPPPPAAADAAEQRLERLPWELSVSAWKRALRVVVTPGETGAPSCPSKLTRTLLDVACESSPATMPLPFGHASRYSVSPSGSDSTHGPGTPMQSRMPLHSFVGTADRGPDGRDGDRDEDSCQQRPSRHPPEPDAAEERAHQHQRHPAARRRRRDLDPLPLVAHPGVEARDDPVEERRVDVVTTWPPLACAIVRSVVDSTGTAICSV